MREALVLVSIYFNKKKKKQLSFLYYYSFYNFISFVSCKNANTVMSYINS